MSDSLLEHGLFDDPQAVIDTKAPEILAMDNVETGDFELLADLIGAEAAWKVAQVFAGSTIYFPKSILTNKNYFEIRRKYKAGSSYRELSVEFGYTETHIRNIIHRRKENA